MTGESQSNWTNTYPWVTQSNKNRLVRGSGIELSPPRSEGGNSPPGSWQGPLNLS
jgi:hypothetical protein